MFAAAAVVTLMVTWFGDGDRVDTSALPSVFFLAFFFTLAPRRLASLADDAPLASSRTPIEPRTRTVRKTLLLNLLIVVPVFGLIAWDAGGTAVVMSVVLAVAFRWYARAIRRWERENGTVLLSRSRAWSFGQPPYYRGPAGSDR